MKIGKIVLGVFLLAVVLSGCASVTTSIPAEGWTDTKYGIAIYTGEPDRPYKKISVLNSSAFWTGQPGEVLSNLTKKAREIGADAIINVQIKPSERGLLGVATGSATAVKWTSKEEEKKSEGVK